MVDDHRRSETRASGLKVVVVGATGNVGTSVVRALSEEPAVGSVLGLARRPRQLSVAETRWACVDVGAPQADLESHCRGADVWVSQADAPGTRAWSQPMRRDDPWEPRIRGAPPEP
ncbi:hypothetical protein ACH4TE_13130 [Streptomyces sioyaensis]|uniref:hypothetical protein n=1 Tax=Streptomyces sioyaensis TaxID=67364 RepID=UPI003794930A